MHAASPPNGPKSFAPCSRPLRRRTLSKKVGRFPGWKLHPLKFARKDAWAMWITGNMRVTFVVRDGVVTEMEIEDYH